MDDFETQGHLDTLQRAADVLADPLKLKKVHKLAGRRHKAVSKMLTTYGPKADKEVRTLADLKDLANERRAATDLDGDEG